MAAQIGGAVRTAETIACEPARWQMMLVGGLVLAALGWSGYLATVSLGWVKLGLCSSGSCSELVLASSWARWMGVPVSGLAMGLYVAVLCILPLAASDDMARRRAAWSVLVALAFMIVGAAIWFVGLMVLHLGKSCGHCASMHMLGMVIAYFLITMAPIGLQPTAMRPRRVLLLAAIALAAVVVLVGGQLLTAATAADEDTAAEETGYAPASTSRPTTLPAHDHDTVTVIDAKGTASSDQPNPNTLDGKAAIVAQLKRDYGDNWNKPTATCHLIPYFASLPGVRATASALYYEVLREGEGTSPRSQDWVRVHFHGKLWTGQVFQDTFAAGRSLDVRVSELIPGLAEALPMMTEGSRWRLLLSSHLAYGATGLPGIVPPDTPVFYEIELLEILPTSQARASEQPQGETHQEPR